MGSSQIEKLPGSIDGYGTPETRYVGAKHNEYL